MLSLELARILLDNTAQSRCEAECTELVEAAVRYARLRVDWALTLPEARAEIDLRRRSAHNVLIDAFNILSRSMAKRGEDNSWRALLGDERRFIGDVACQMHCLLGIQAA